jgi:hypothetical protein
MSNKYENAKIYKIVSPSNPELVYFGSTTQMLNMRMAGHRAHYKVGKSCTSHVILEKGDAMILLVENYPCTSREELNKKEGEYIFNNQCVNKRVAGRDKEQWKQMHLDWQKMHYQRNKDKIQERHKAYNSSNVDKIKEYQKKYRDMHKKTKLETNIEV